MLVYTYPKYRDYTLYILLSQVTYYLISISAQMIMLWHIKPFMFAKLNCSPKICCHISSYALH